MSPPPLSAAELASGQKIGAQNQPDTPIRVSFEFFPPKTPAMYEQLWASIERLAPLQPNFVSVTYGAGGSTRERTHEVVDRIQREKGLKAAAHLTCVAATSDEVNEVARRYWASGIRHIVALRGDPPDGAATYTPHPGGYAFAADLVAGLKKVADFEISVAANPEGHPEAPTKAADIDNLKRKIDAGASRAITQFFFDVDVYRRFRDQATKAGINVPILPGIMPVTNFASAARMAVKAGATVPQWLHKLYDGLEDDVETRRLVAATVVAEQVKLLKADGVTDFHFYTLNRADLTYAICHILGLRAQK
ncbi:MAG: methylenetetrahydrofolate reductase [Rhodospirillaceae bacterium]|nr:methylenetetrahydrofolate reductase [Rhodospirillaceae bacterium]